MNAKRLTTAIIILCAIAAIIATAAYYYGVYCDYQTEQIHAASKSTPPPHKN